MLNDFQGYELPVFPAIKLFPELLLGHTIIEPLIQISYVKSREEWVSESVVRVA